MRVWSVNQPWSIKESLIVPTLLDYTVTRYILPFHVAGSKIKNLSCSCILRYFHETLLKTLRGGPDPRISGFDSAIWKSVFFYLDPQILSLFRTGLLELCSIENQFFRWKFTLGGLSVLTKADAIFEIHDIFDIPNDREKNSLSDPP